MPLTDLKVRALKPDVRPRRYSDGGNMYLEVKPNGSKLWRMAYSYAGKQKTMAFGVYPETSLAEAREPGDRASRRPLAGLSGDDNGVIERFNTAGPKGKRHRKSDARPFLAAVCLT